MSVTSPKQWRLMAGIAHGMKPTKLGKRHGAGPSPEVAKEFIEKTPAKKRKQFAKSKY